VSDPSIIPEPERSLSLRLREAFRKLKIGHYPGGQCEDQDHGFLWSPTDEKDWHAGGDGDLAPNLSHKTSVAILIGMLVRRGWIVDSWSSRNMTIFRIEDGVERRGSPSEAVVAAFEADVEKSL